MIYRTKRQTLVILRQLRIVLCVAVVGFICIVGTGTSHAAGYQVVYSLSGPLIPSSPTGGNQPSSILLGNDGSFYGAAPYGGEPAYPSGGAVFRVTQQGGYQTIQSFPTAQGGSVVRPGGLTQGSDGSLFGVTNADGQGGKFFRISPGGSLTYFANRQPNCFVFGYGGNLIQGTDGNLYGTCSTNLTPQDSYVFRVTNAGSLVQLGSAFRIIKGPTGILYALTAVSQTPTSYTLNRVNADGTFTLLASLPTNIDLFSGSFLVGTDGNYYAAGRCRSTTVACIGRYAAGTGAFTLLTTFPQEYGDTSGSLLRDVDGSLYGVIYSITYPIGGLLHSGVVYRLTPSSQLMELRRFNEAEVFIIRNPFLVGIVGGVVYGGARSGGAYDNGSIFKIDLNGTPPPSSSIGISSTVSVSGADVTYEVRSSNSGPAQANNVIVSFELPPNSSYLSSSSSSTCEFNYAPIEFFWRWSSPTSVRCKMGSVLAAQSVSALVTFRFPTPTVALASATSVNIKATTESEDVSRGNDRLSAVEITSINGQPVGGDVPIMPPWGIALLGGVLFAGLVRHRKRPL
jgi:uncharacterized repeat protein (TIGR01451 family)